MDYKDYYQILGIDKTAGPDEIKKAYRKLARQHHPDVNQGDSGAEQRFKEINEAFQVLSDPEKRQKYDQLGSQWQQYAHAGGRPEDFNWSQWRAQPDAANSYTRTVSPEDLEQIFGGGRGGFSSFFETLFGGNVAFNDFNGGQTYQPRSHRGRDSETVVEISLEEAFHGTTRSIQWQDGRQIMANIPPGVRTGSRVRLAGQGEPGIAGSASGDLYLQIQVTPHPLYRRENDDLHLEIPVDLYTALLGGKIEVSSIDRTVSLTIPAGTQNGKTFRLRGLGMPQLRHKEHRGDLYVSVQIKLPENLSQKEIEMYKQLSDLRK
ncbi:MAG: J domain-containing protein [Anaerolineales bacterium]|nr:J domain-containing protein [Anaerolineales bacterium]